MKRKAFHKAVGKNNRRQYPFVLSNFTPKIGLVTVPIIWYFTSNYAD
jgi:hypothetical protein